MEGRNILDNLLTYRLAQEMVAKAKLEDIMLKSDFMKAYDRIEHLFIWETMKKLEYNPHLIKLARGLVENVESKVHVNGRFTDSIKLDRGVRQGCPLSSLLFIISTKPLMTLLKNKVSIDELEGIPMGNDEQLTHQLFADDTSVFMTTNEENFRCVREVIRTYERISRACLNLSKSILIPLYMDGPIPQWLIGVGCKIAMHREVITYLDCPIGYGITASMEAKFLIGKVRKRLHHWENWLLSWDGKVVLLKHMRKAIPSYHLMVLSLNK